MALQLGALRSALIDAGASPEKAERAAEEMAGYEHKLAGIETRLAVLVVMVSGVYAIILPAAWLLVRVAYKIGALG